MKPVPPRDPPAPGLRRVGRGARAWLASPQQPPTPHARPGRPRTLVSACLRLSAMITITSHLLTTHKVVQISRELTGASEKWSAVVVATSAP